MPATTRAQLLELGDSLGLDEEMVDSTLEAMDGDIEQTANVFRGQGAKSSGEY
jgi:hypothetical protein